VEWRGDISICDGMGSFEKNFSNSDWVKREGCPSSVERRSERFFSGRELKWGKQAEKRNKIIPTNRILCIIRMPPESVKISGKEMKREKIYKKMA
jgi:hypothetical protein